MRNRVIESFDHGHDVEARSIAAKISGTGAAHHPIVSRIARDRGSAHHRQTDVRSGTSVAANRHAVCRARSSREFISKIGVVVEEADETVFWLELLVESGIVAKPLLDSLLTEANELLAIFAASQRTARSRSRKATTNDSITQ